MSREVAHLGSSESTVLTQRIEVVEQRISQIKDELLGELQRELLTSRTQSIEQAKDELLSELQGELPKTEALPGQLELLVEANEQIEEQDGELPSESKSELPKEEEQYIETPKPSSTNQTFATKDLANRLGMNSSTVSHWRPTGGRPKTPEQLLEITRKRDPDGIGWIYLPGVKRFQPERDIHSELPKVLESSSPDVIEPEF